MLPTFIDLDRWNVALSRTLNKFPPVAGRLRKAKDVVGVKGGIYIQLTNDGIPVTVVDDFETSSWPFTNVGGSACFTHQMNTDYSEVLPSAEGWTSNIPTSSVIDQDEPLVRFKLTRLHKTGELVYTCSWLHALGKPGPPSLLCILYTQLQLGDGATNILFLIYLAHFYRGSDTGHLPSPSFQKPFFPPPPSDPASRDMHLPLMKHIRDAQSFEIFSMAIMESIQTSVPINITFHPKHLRTLVEKAVAGSPNPGSARISRTNAMFAYLIYAYNSVLAQIEPEREMIDTVVNTIDYRGSHPLTPPALFGNTAITMACPSFTLPDLLDSASPHSHDRYFKQTLAIIAHSIDAGSARLADPTFLDAHLRFHHDLCNQTYQKNLFQNILPSTPREMTFNSCFSVNFRQGGDFDDRDPHNAGSARLRFHTVGIMENYVRIFGPNPTPRGDGKWDFELEGGAEAAFSIKKHLVEGFKSKVQRDMEQNFTFSGNYKL